MTTKIDPIQDRLHGHLVENGLNHDCIVEYDDTYAEKRYYIRTPYSLSGVVERCKLVGGGYKILLEYVTGDEMADNCGFIEQQFGTIQDMLASLKFHLAIFKALRKALDNIL